jgi:hypothetical protein
MSRRRDHQWRLESCFTKQTNNNKQTILSNSQDRHRNDRREGHIPGRASHFLPVHVKTTMKGQVSVVLVSLLTEHRINPTESLTKALQTKATGSSIMQFWYIHALRYLVNLSIRRPTAKLPKRKPNEEIIMMNDISPTVAPTKSWRKFF